MEVCGHSCLKSSWQALSFSMECIKAFKAELTQWFEVTVSEEVLKNVRSSRSYDVTTPPPDDLDSDFEDQYEKISTHTQNGAHFLENFQAFIKERALIEFEYADKLRKMARKYQPKKTRGQGQEDEETNFSTHVAFNKMLEEVAHLANQHEIISEELIQNIAKEIAGLVRELKDERKRLLGEGTKLQQNLQNYVAQMDKCQKAYGKAHREAEKAHEKYERAEKDMHLSRAEVEIAKQSSVAKNQLCEDAKAEYAAQLQKTNELQRMHFNEYMPRVFNDLQQMDERRITCIQNFMKQVAESQLKVEPIIHNCLNGIMAAAGGIDAVKDSERVVETYKSGFFPPDDFPFENLSEEKPNGASLTYSSSTSGVGHKDKLTIRGTLSGKTKKRNILANIFGQTNKNNNEDAKEETWIDLPPNQRKKKIQKKLKDVRSELEHETNQRDGLHKMRRTYEENPNLGDAASLNAESERCNRRIESLHEQVQKLQSLLNEIESSTPDTAKRHSGHTRGNSIISEDTGSLSRSNSDESNIHNNSGTQRIMSAAANAKNVLSKATNGISAVKHSLSRNNSASSGSTNSSQAVTPLTPTSPSTHSACLSAASGALLANMTNMSNGSHGLVGDTSVSTCSGPLSPASNGHHHITPIEEEVYATIPGGGAYTTNGDHAAYNSESGVGSGSLRDIDDPEFEDHHEEDETLPPLGTAIALYTFEAENEGAIAMTENDEMYIVELDQGDGWTRVRMRSTGEEGFVPSSYIEISMYNTC